MTIIQTEQIAYIIKNRIKKQAQKRKKRQQDQPIRSFADILRVIENSL